MITRRNLLCVPPVLAALAVSRRALAVPRVTETFPRCAVHDLNDHPHTARELRGRRTFVTVITGTGASEHMRHWLNDAEARYGRGGPIVAIVALNLAFYAWDDMVRSQARGHTPQWRWNYVWLDRSGALQRALGFPDDNDVPWAYVVEPDGTVSVATHGLATDPAAQQIWARMSAPLSTPSPTPSSAPSLTPSPAPFPAPPPAPSPTPPPSP